MFFTGDIGSGSSIMELLLSASQILAVSFAA